MKRSRTTRNLLLFFIFVMATIFTPDQYLDLFRYYQEANSINLGMSLEEVYNEYMSRSSDFIYFTTYYIFRLIGLPVHLVNGLYVTLFYGASFILLEDYVNTQESVKPRDINVAMTCMIFALPLTFVFSIARMTASFALIFLGLHMLINNKKIVGTLLIGSGILTHVGSVMMLSYLAISILAGFFMSSWKLTRKHNIFGLILLSGFAYVFLIYGVQMILELPFFSTYKYFATYLENMRTASMEGLGGITSITLLYYLFCVIFFAWRANLVFPYNTSLYLIPFLIMSYFMSDMFLQRMSMFMIPFFGISMIGATKKSQNLQLLITALAVFLGCSCIVATNRFYLP